MRRCVVSIEGQDRQVHSIEVEAVSLVAAAHEAVVEWGRFWFPADGVIDVHSGDQRWRVGTRRVSAWYNGQFRARLRPEAEARPRTVKIISNRLPVVSGINCRCIAIVHGAARTSRSISRATPASNASLAVALHSNPGQPVIDSKIFSCF